jgi:tRNA(Ile)-lysidine synthase
MSRTKDLYTRWAAEMRRGAYFRPGERVGVAVSGGPDSVLLLEFVKQFAPGAGLVVAAVHFNHHLRGAASDEDERFVRDLARNAGMQFIRGEADVARVAREKHRNLEATARELRYRFFFSLVTRGRLDQVLTAHTANDQAETVFLRLLRGAGTRGLGGIYPTLGGKVFRPFLSLTRPEIEAELQRRQLVCRTDASNLDARFRRNKIRLELFPWLRKEFNLDVVPLLKGLADRARDDEAYLEEQARVRAQPWRVREGDAEKIPVRPLAEFPRALARRVLRQMILATRGSLRGITHQHLEALYRLATHAQSGGCLPLPGNVLARREFDWLCLAPCSGDSEGQDFACAVHPPAAVDVPQMGVRVRLKIVGAEEIGTAYNGGSAADLVDPLKLRGGLVLRNWRAGDRFRPQGHRDDLKLKELFRQRRIPVDQRRHWPVLESGNEIVWVRGFPVAASFAISPASQQAMVICEEAVKSESEPQ